MVVTGLAPKSSYALVTCLEGDLAGMGRAPVHKARSARRRGAPGAPQCSRSAAIRRKVLTHRWRRRRLRPARPRSRGRVRVQEFPARPRACAAGGHVPEVAARARIAHAAAAGPGNPGV